MREVTFVRMRALLLFESCQYFLRVQALGGEPLLEAQAGVVQELVEGVAVGLHAPGGLLERDILDAQ